jgi:hypothetical protein
MWDDDVAVAAEPYDLADFAKAALKFRSDMDDLKGSSLVASDVGEDAITSLMDAQTLELAPVVEKSTGFTSESTLTSLLLEGNSSSINGSNFSSGLSTTLLPSSSGLDSNVLFGSSLHFGTPFSMFGATEKVEPVEWLYRDPQGAIQGPFSQENMRLWNDEGYFTLDLPIRLVHWQKFHPFKDVFANSSFAFMEVPTEPVSAFSFSATAEKPTPFTQLPIFPDTATTTTVFDRVAVVKPAVPVTIVVDMKKVDTPVTQNNVEKNDLAKKLLGRLTGGGKPQSDNVVKDDPLVSSTDLHVNNKKQVSSQSADKPRSNVAMLTKIVSSTPDSDETAIKSTKVSLNLTVDFCVFLNI